MRARRIAAAGLLLISFAVTARYVVHNAKTEFAGIGGWGSDHASHFSSAILFYYRGLDIYRKPLRELCNVDDPAAKQYDREHIHRDQGLNFFCQIQARAEHGRRPLYVNWPEFPRVYPPGLLLLSAPEALLWERTRLSFRAVCAVSIVKFLFFAHAAIFVVGLLVLGTKARPFPNAPAPTPGSGYLAVLFVAYEMLRWALSGFYDPVAIFFVFLALYLAFRERWAWALVALSAAMFLHFRTLWFLPLFPYFAFRLVRARQLPAKSAWVGLAAAVLMLGISAWVFHSTYDAMKDLPKSNPLFHDDLKWDSAKAWSLGLLTLAVVIDSLLARNWLLAVAILWQAVMVTRIPQVQWWHGVFTLPLIGVAQLGRDRQRGTLAALVVCVAQMLAVYSENPLPGDFAIDLIKKNF